MILRMNNSTKLYPNLLLDSLRDIFLARRNELWRLVDSR